MSSQLQDQSMGPIQPPINHHHNIFAVVENYSTSNNTSSNHKIPLTTYSFPFLSPLLSKQSKLYFQPQESHPRQWEKKRKILCFLSFFKKLINSIASSFNHLFSIILQPLIYGFLKVLAWWQICFCLRSLSQPHSLSFCLLVSFLLIFLASNAIL